MPGLGRAPRSGRRAAAQGITIRGQGGLSEQTFSCSNRGHEARQLDSPAKASASDVAPPVCCVRRRLRVGRWSCPRAIELRQHTPRRSQRDDGEHRRRARERWLGAIPESRNDRADRRREVRVQREHVSVRSRNVSNWHTPQGADAARYGSFSHDQPNETQSRLDALPSTICFFFTLRGLGTTIGEDRKRERDLGVRGRQKLAACLGTTERESSDYPVLNFHTGGNTVTQSQSYRHNWNRLQIGPTWSLYVTDRLAIGASFHGGLLAIRAVRELDQHRRRHEWARDGGHVQRVGVGACIRFLRRRRLHVRSRQGLDSRGQLSDACRNVVWKLLRERGLGLRGTGANLARAWQLLRAATLPIGHWPR